MITAGTHPLFFFYERNICMEFSPLYSFIKSYKDKNVKRLHMPGHKGNGDIYPDEFKSVIPFDITEIKGADALFEADGVIGESEKITAEIFGVKNTCFSAGGSTLSILAMVAIASDFTKRILAVRNSHIAFVNACALTGVEPLWIFPEYDKKTGLCLPVTAEEIDKNLSDNPDIKVVYITTPDYYGVIADVKKIAETVHKHGAILMVDNAHGTHLKFCKDDIHPITLGANICCDSPHKTLPVLTGGSYIHSNLDITKAEIKGKMALFGSTSPSYLIMASLDVCNTYLKTRAKTDFMALEEKVYKTEKLLRENGVTLLDRKTDITKITIDCQNFGYTDDEISEILRQNNIEPEYSGGGKVVLMPSPFNPDEDFEKIVSALKLPVKEAIPYPEFDSVPEKVCTIREARFSPSYFEDVEKATGKIAAENKITCPPGIPIVVAGEKIGENEKKLLKNSGIFSIKVVK